MKNRAGIMLAVFLLSLVLLWGCAGTQLHGWVYDSQGKPIGDAKVKIRAEPGGKSTWTREDGSFVLKGLKPDNYYTIIASCKADNTATPAQVDKIYIHKGWNEFPEGKKLQLVCEEKEATAHEDTTESVPPTTGDTRVD